VTTGRSGHAQRSTMMLPPPMMRNRLASYGEFARALLARAGTEQRLTRRFPLRDAFAPLGRHIRCELSVSVWSVGTCLRSFKPLRGADSLSARRKPLERYGVIARGAVSCCVAVRVTDIQVTARNTCAHGQSLVGLP
jgi:hypothetical protein